MPLLGKMQRAIVRARFYLRRHPDRADPAVIPARAGPVDEQRGRPVHCGVPQPPIGPPLRCDHRVDIHVDEVSVYQTVADPKNIAAR